MKDFGKRLYVLRKSRKMSSEQVAEKVGTSRITIRSYEKEETFPNIEMLNRLADCYNVSSDFLLGRNPYPTAKLDIAKMCEYTGLNPKSINLLHSYSNEREFTSVFNFILSNEYKTALLKFCMEIDTYKTVSELFDEHNKKYIEALNSFKPNRDKEIAKEIYKRRYFEDQKTVSSKRITRFIQQIVLDYSNGNPSKKIKYTDKSDDMVALLQKKREHFNQIKTDQKDKDKFNNEMFENIITSCGGTIIAIENNDSILVDLLLYVIEYFEIEPEKFMECLNQHEKIITKQLETRDEDGNDNKEE